MSQGCQIKLIKNTGHLFKFEFQWNSEYSAVYVRPMQCLSHSPFPSLAVGGQVGARGVKLLPSSLDL